MTFLQPLFLAFAPLVLAPLLFFLLGPRITREVRFSWVQLLLGDLQEGRRGHRLQDLLLVLLRMLILACLVLAMARPVWFGGSLPTRIVVDASWSMQPHWEKLVRNLQGLSGIVPVEGLTEGRLQELPPRPYGTLQAFPPSGALWITDGQHGEGPGSAVILPRPCNRGIHVLSLPLAVLPDTPFDLSLLAYSTCEDTLTLLLPEGRTRLALRDHRDTVSLTVEGCVDVSVEGQDAFPQDNRLKFCPPARPPVRVALVSATPDTLLLSRLLSVFPAVFLRTPRDDAEAWVLVGNVAVDYDDLRAHRGVWFSPPDGMDPGPSWRLFPFLPDEEGGTRLVENPDLFRAFYEALLGGTGIWLLEEGDSLKVPADHRIQPAPGKVEIHGDTLHALFTRSGVFRVMGPADTVLVVVQPPLREAILLPSPEQKGHLPLPLSRPLVLAALILILLEVILTGRLNPVRAGKTPPRKG